MELENNNSTLKIGGIMKNNRGKDKLVTNCDWFKIVFETISQLLEPPIPEKPKGRIGFVQ